MLEDSDEPLTKQSLPSCHIVSLPDLPSTSIEHREPCMRKRGESMSSIDICFIRNIAYCEVLRSRACDESLPITELIGFTSSIHYPWQFLPYCRPTTAQLLRLSFAPSMRTAVQSFPLPFPSPHSAHPSHFRICESPKRS